VSRAGAVQEIGIQADLGFHPVRQIDPPWKMSIARCAGQRFGFLRSKITAF
jgi:hypothetical protein